MIFAELICGIFVALGFLTRLTIIPIIIDLAVAFFIAHAKDAFAVKELAFVFLLLSIAVLIAGSGRFSVDALIFRKRYKKESLQAEKGIGWSV